MMLSLGRIEWGRAGRIKAGWGKFVYYRDCDLKSECIREFVLSFLIMNTRYRFSKTNFVA